MRKHDQPRNSVVPLNLKPWQLLRNHSRTQVDFGNRISNAVRNKNQVGLLSVIVVLCRPGVFPMEILEISLPVIPTWYGNTSGADVLRADVNRHVKTPSFRSDQSLLTLVNISLGSPFRNCTWKSNPDYERAFRWLPQSRATFKRMSPSRHTM